MRRTSIKTRITLWYAVFILLIVALMLFALLLSQHRLSQNYYYEKLISAANDAAENIALVNGEIALETQTDTGVRITVLDEAGNLLLGKRRFSAKLKEEALRVREGNSEANWYLLDKPVTLADGRTVWLRCYISTALTARTNRTLTLTLCIMLPLLLAIVVAGGYRMTRFAFQPIDEISRTAENISDSSDLKQRIHLEGQTDEVGRLAATFDGMFARLERSLENEKRFISDASHELRTPLTVICAQSEYALTPGRTPEEKDAALRIIHERGQRTSEMLRQMLMLSRMDYRKQPLNLERTDLSALTESLTQEMQAQADARGIRIECDVAPGVEMVCDEILILRMLTNLIQNSIQYGRDGGRTRVSLRREDDCIVLCVEDDGMGISAEDQKKIWNRFYQAHKAESTGSGLGLPIVKWIVDAHGGSIELLSRPDAGSRFTARFPNAGAQ